MILAVFGPHFGMGSGIEGGILEATLGDDGAQNIGSKACSLDLCDPPLCRNSHIVDSKAHMRDGHRMLLYVIGFCDVARVTMPSWVLKRVYAWCLRVICNMASMHHIRIVAQVSASLRLEPGTRHWGLRHVTTEERKSPSYLL